MLQRDHALCQCEVHDYARVRQVTKLLRAPPAAPAAGGGGGGGGATATVEGWEAPPDLCSRCTAVRCKSFRPLACIVELPSMSLVEDRTGGGGGRGGSGAASAAQRSEAVHASGCAAAGGEPMSLSECRSAAGVRDFGRKWLGSSREAGEAAGCVLWEDGNVEYNTFVPASPAQATCHVRGTCLCKRRPTAAAAGGAAAELQVVGQLRAK